MAPKLSRKPPRRPRRGNLAIQAADRLRTAILRGKYGDEHPLREVELCRELGISRIPLREALHRLEGEGLVEIRPNRGAAVASLSPAELAEIAELCRMIEGHLLRHSIPGLKRELLDRAGTLLELMDEV